MLNRLLLKLGNLVKHVREFNACPIVKFRYQACFLDNDFGMVYNRINQVTVIGNRGKDKVPCKTIKIRRSSRKEKQMTEVDLAYRVRVV